MSKITYTHLRDICDVNQGLQIPIEERFKEPNENRYFYITVQFLKDSYLEKYYVENPSKSTICEEDDILVVRTGNTGQIITGIKGCFHNNFFKVNFDKNKLNSKYLYYCLTTKEKQYEMAKRAGITTIPDLNHFMFLDMQIPLQEKENQDKIVQILDSLNQKIELNNKINKELEAMAKTLYDYWFVQFDFPEENGKSYKSSGGKMVYNQELKREIPEGWEVKNIAQLIGNNKGGDWGKEQKEGNYTQKVSCIRGADLNGLNGLGELNPPERFILDKNSNKILESHDLIVEISGGSPTQSTGRLSFIIDETITRFENPLICSNFCKSFSLKNSKYFYYFIYMWNNLYDNNVLFGWEGKTSGIKNLLFDSFTQKYFIVVPNESINQKFYEKMNSFHKMKQNNLKENQELAKLRDWLLPMLMNGQVKVK